MMQVQYITHSSSETKKIGRSLAKAIQKKGPQEKAFILALIGDLGGGKTTFLQGFAKGLGVKDTILSPTFIIMKRFEIEDSKFLNFYHIDCYRVEKEKEILDLGLKKIISNPKNIVAIEWADKIKKALPPKCLNIKFEFLGKKTRKIIFLNLANDVKIREQTNPSKRRRDCMIFQEEKKKRFLIIDGNALIHRAYHALPPLRTGKGELVNAVYGFLLVFLKAVRELHPDFVAATFDLPAPTFRHKKFEEYKAKRPKVPKELSQQIPIVKRILKAFHVPIFEREGYEADDIIGTLSKKCTKRQVFPRMENIILSGDLDTLQLIDENTKVYTMRKGVKETVIYDQKKVKERYGLEPEQLVDFKALKGDPSDNILGVPGIGEKTAIYLIKKYKNLEKLYKAIEESSFLEKKSLKKKLLEYKEQAFFSKILVEIKKDVSLEFDLEKCSFGRYNEKEVISLLKKFEFFSLVPKIFELRGEKFTSQKQIF